MEKENRGEKLLDLTDHITVSELQKSAMEFLNSIKLLRKALKLRIVSSGSELRRENLPSRQGMHSSRNCMAYISGGRRIRSVK